MRFRIVAIRGARWCVGSRWQDAPMFLYQGVICEQVCLLIGEGAADAIPWAPVGLFHGLGTMRLRLAKIQVV